MSDQLSADLASLRIERGALPARRSLLRRLLWPAIGLAVVLGGGALLAKKYESAVFRHEVRTSAVTILSPSQADVLVTATGYVIPQLTSKVGAKIQGRLAKVLVKEGDTVKAGDLIAQLEDQDQFSSLNAAGSRFSAAQARIAQANANLAEISLQVERERALVATHAVAKSTFDDLLAREATLRQAVKAAMAEAVVSKADVGVVNVGLKDREIRAPIGGRIVTKPATIGEAVGGVGNTALIAEIDDFDSLLVETDVPEPRLHNVKIGGPCEIVLEAYPSLRYRGHTVELGTRVNRAKGTVMVKVKIDDEHEGVLPEMSARVSFLSRGISDAEKKEAAKKVVPEDTITERDGRKVVFTVEDGAARAYPVRVGEKVGTSGIVELLDGPPEGAHVVSRPKPELKDGQHITETDK